MRFKGSGNKRKYKNQLCGVTDNRSGVLYLILCAVFLLFPTSTSYSQTEPDSLLFLSKFPNLLSNKFYKQFNTFSYQTNANYSSSVNNWSFSVKEDFRSTLIKSGENSIRDDQKFNFSVGYSFSPILNIGIYADNGILSDSRKIGINQASISNLLIYNRTQLQSSILLVPYIGYQNNRQSGVSDYGYIYGIEASAENYSMLDFNISSLLKIRQEDISPRNNGAINLRLMLNNNIENEIDNTIQFSYNRLRRDFYFITDSLTQSEFGITNNIQSRIENLYSIRDNLTYQNIINNLDLTLSGVLGYRTIERDTRYKSVKINSPSIFDTEIDELKFDLETNLMYRIDKHTISFKGIYSQRNEKNITKKLENANPIFYEERAESEARKNNISDIASLSLNADFALSARDKLMVSLSQYKLKYDTPSPLNLDDRDELLSIVKINYQRNISSFFDFFISLEGDLSKLVYLSSKRSSNNFTNRVLKLLSGGIYKGSGFRSINTFEVSANYTVYDFEDLKPNYSSYAFRQFSITDSTTINLSSGLHLNIYGYLKLSEQGEFRWKDFSMKPGRFVKETLLLPNIATSYEGIDFSVGLRYFSLVTYGFNKSIREMDSDYYSLGPTSMVRYGTDKIMIGFSGWFDFITQKNKNSGGFLLNRDSYTNINFDLDWYF
ncbi:MAG: hypothetical protein GX452_10055 [Ignavibacteriales bacterium]|nr:hypothetical protein [Ignavibacteriaceae bacterium]NLH61734.1 hypothetical protein [Ignavibacteriales bacterium]HOJ19316.1 hypothetical protein [Ignavibacteriaceae bacterium]